MRKSQWIAGILALIVLAVIAGKQLGVSGADAFWAARAGIDILSKVGWTLAALGGLALALRTHDRAAGFYALALLIGAAARWGAYLGATQTWAWVNPFDFVLLALAMLSWAPGALSRWLLGVGALRAVVQWLFLAEAPLRLSPPVAAALNLILIGYWALFAAAAWQGCKTWRPLLWLSWQGVISVIMLLFSVGQLLFPVQLPEALGWTYLVLAPVPMLTTLGFIWSAFPRTQIASRP